MSFFVIASGSETDRQPHCLSFDCGIEGTNRAILLFTSRHSAEDYIEMAGWKARYSVESMEPTELLKCLIHAKDCGITHVAIEPKREEQLCGTFPELVPLHDPYCAHADILRHLQIEIGEIATG